MGRRTIRSQEAAGNGRAGRAICGSTGGAIAASQVSGRVNRTRWPRLGPKHKRPVNAAGLRMVPQLLCASLAPNVADPVSRATCRASSSRVITRDGDGFRQAVELLDRDAEIFLPQSVLEIPPVGAESGLPEGKFVGGKQVQRAPHGPGFDERAVLPQRSLNGAAVEAFHSGPYGELGRRHYLGMQAAETAGNRKHAAGGGAPVEMMAVYAPGGRSRPGELQHSLITYIKYHSIRSSHEEHVHRPEESRSLPRGHST